MPEPAGASDGSVGARPEVFLAALSDAATVADRLDAYLDPDALVIKDLYTWEHVKRRYYYEEDGSQPCDAEGETVEFEPEELLGFDPADTEGRLSAGESAASALADVVEERTVNVNPELDEDAFFSTVDGETTVTDRYDLEKAVPMEKKTHFRERERYWVNEPYAFVIVFRSDRDNETKYYLIEPYRNAIETDLTEFLVEKLRTAIKYTDDALVEDDDGRRDVIDRETRRLLERYDLYERPAGINVRDVYQWQAESDEYLEMGGSNTLEEIRFDRGWSHAELDEQLFLRKVVLAYLIENGLNEYRQVAATLQAFINDPETITALIANDELAASLEDLREMESVLIDVDPEKEALVPRPEPNAETSETARGILDRAESEVFEEHRGPVAAGVGDALVTEPAEDVTTAPAAPDEDASGVASDGGEPSEARRSPSERSSGGGERSVESRTPKDERRESAASDRERGEPSETGRSVEPESSIDRGFDEESG